MDLLIAEPIESEVLRWLQARQRVQYAPDFAEDPRGFRQALYNVRAALVPVSLRIDEQMLSFAPLLRAIGRVAPGLEHIDIDACARGGVEVVRGATATAPSEAEFAIGAVMSMLRGLVPVPPIPLVGRELATSTIGVIGMVPAARSIAALLSGFGPRLIGYDPSLHASDILWGRWRIEPMGLAELFETADAVIVQLPYYSRYRGLIGERYLQQARGGQVIVSTSHAAIFEPNALALGLRSGRIAAAWLDHPDHSWLEPEQPLHGLSNVVVTRRLAGYTAQARERAVWAVAQRLDEILTSAPAGPRELRGSGPVSGPLPLEATGIAPVPMSKAVESARPEEPAPASAPAPSAANDAALSPPAAPDATAESAREQGSH
ncbi:NAD(P)-dependent oxidoreductase [Caldimonas sp. KR1-144]|uniref:NAD(P)-dependent oxidoreductase n=1 Tax=Caldimonas sp. KR1-144 TaxID=3400911 RepID=UPI003C110D96